MKKEVFDLAVSFNQYLENVAKGSVQIAEHLRKDELQEAMQLIFYFSEGMTWLIQASELLKQNKVEVDFEHEKINEFLNEINNGLEIQDYVIVADMFEYEIAPYFEEVKRIEGFDH